MLAEAVSAVAVLSSVLGAVYTALYTLINQQHALFLTGSISIIVYAIATTLRVFRPDSSLFCTGANIVASASLCTAYCCYALVNHTTHTYIFESSAYISRQTLIKLLAFVVLVQTIVTVADATTDSFKLTSAVAAGTGSIGSLVFEVLNCWNSRSLISNPKLGVNYWSLCLQSVFVGVSAALYSSAHIVAKWMDAKNVLLLAFSIVMDVVLLSTLFNSYEVSLSLDLVLPRVNEKSAGFDKLGRVEIEEMGEQTLHHKVPAMESATLESPLGVLEIHVQEGRNLRNVEFGGISDPYCVIHLEHEKWATTKTIENCLRPVWAETFQLIVYPSMLVQDSQLILNVSVFDANETQNDKLMGSTQSLDLRQWLQATHGISLPVNTSESNSTASGGEQLSWQPLYKQNGGKTSGEIRIGLTFTPVQCTESEAIGKGKGKGILGVFVHGARNLKSVYAAAVSCQISLIKDEKSVEQVVGHTPTSDCFDTPMWEYAASAIISDSNSTRVRFRVMHDTNSIGILTLNLARIIDHLPQHSNHDQLNNDAIWHALQGKSVTTDAPAALRLTLRWFPLKPQTCIQQTDTPMGMARINILKAFNLKNIEIGGGKSDPYARISISGVVVGETQVLQNSLDPIWNETFYASIYSIDAQLLQVQVWDSNSLTSDGLIGTAEIPLESLRKVSDKDGIKMEQSGTSMHVTAPLIIKNQAAPRGTVVLELEFYSADSNATIPALSLEDSELLQPKTSETEDAVLRLTQSYENGVLSREDMQDRVDRIRQKGYVGNVDPSKAHLFHRNNRGTVFEQCDSGILHFKILEAKDVPSSTSISFVSIHVDDASVFSTESVSGTEPRWNARADVCLPHVKSQSVSLVLCDGSPRSKQDVLFKWQGNISSVVGSTQWINVGSAKILISLGFTPTSTVTTNPLQNSPGILEIEIISTSNLHPSDSRGTSDPYILVHLDNLLIHKTRTLKNTLNAIFNEHVTHAVQSRHGGVLKFVLRDYNTMSSHVTIGTAEYSLTRLVPNELVKLSLPLEGGRGGTVDVHIRFDPEALDTVNRMETLPKKSLPKPERRVTLDDRSCVAHVETQSNAQTVKVSTEAERALSGHVELTVVEAKNLMRVDENGFSDPYVKLLQVCNGKVETLLKTRIIKKTLNPVWNETVRFHLLPLSTLSIVLKDKNFLDASKPLGQVEVDLSLLFGRENEFDTWIPVGMGGEGEVRVKARMLVDDVVASKKKSWARDKTHSSLF